MREVGSVFFVEARYVSSRDSLDNLLNTVVQRKGYSRPADYGPADAARNWSLGIAYLSPLMLTAAWTDSVLCKVCMF